jgi:TolB-like protein
MSKKPNIIVRFWQELKRRKVFKVIAMYAGTAYVIIQVVEMLSDPLHMPPWITTLVIILLSAGFPVVAVLAWIFDLTPEGIKKTESLEVSESKEEVAAPLRRRLKASDVVITVLAIAVIILAYPKVFKRDAIENLRAKGKIAVAVMPFQNMTNDTSWNVWQDGIQNELISFLTNSEELKVRQPESTKSLLLAKGLNDYALITSSLASNISRRLDADVFVYGSIKESGKSMRINAQLIDSKTGDIFKSFQIDGVTDDIIHLIDSLSTKVKNFLIISILQKTYHRVQHLTTNSPEALRYYIYGINAATKFDWKSAREWLSKATAEDSNFIPAATALASTYSNFMYNPDVDLNQ